MVGLCKSSLSVWLPAEILAHPHRKCLTTVPGKMGVTIHNHPVTILARIISVSSVSSYYKEAKSSSICTVPKWSRKDISRQVYRENGVLRGESFFFFLFWIYGPPLVCIDAKLLAIPTCRTSRQSCHVKSGQV